MLLWENVYVCYRHWDFMNYFQPTSASSYVAQSYTDNTWSMTFNRSWKKKKKTTDPGQDNGLCGNEHRQVLLLYNQMKCGSIETRKGKLLCFITKVWYYTGIRLSNHHETPRHPWNRSPSPHGLCVSSRLPESARSRALFNYHTYIPLYTSPQE